MYQYSPHEYDARQHSMSSTNNNYNLHGQSIAAGGSQQHVVFTTNNNCSFNTTYNNYNLNCHHLPGENTWGHDFEGVPRGHRQMHPQVMFPAEPDLPPQNKRSFRTS